MAFDKRLFQQAQNAKIALQLTILTSLLGGVVIVGQAFCLSRIVNRVFLLNRPLSDISPLLLILFGLSLLRAAFTWVGQITAQRAAGQVKTDLRDKLAAHLLALGPGYARTQQSGELANTVIEGVEALDAYFSQYLPQLATAALIPLTILLVVFPLDLTSGLVFLFTAPLIPVFMILIGNAAEGLTRKQWQSLSRMNARFLDTLQGLSTLKLLGQSRAQIAVVAQISHQFRQTTMDVLRVAFLSALALELIATLSTAVIAVEVGLRLLYAHIDFEKAFFILILAPEFYIPLRMLGARFHAGMAGVAAAQRIFEVLARPLPPSGLAGPARPIPAQPNLAFEAVSFAYPDRSQPAIQNVSFTLNRGQTVALVGPSGAGKSTVAALLLRLIEPQAGQIYAGGVPLAQLDPARWRSQIGWVPQRPYLFNASVADNIRLARPQAADETVIRAARQAHADEFIRNLPRQYQTVIGEQGWRLSGGQAQRLALARAFLQNAPLLVLDEATANLDPATQELIVAAIKQLMAGRTTLLIAHRLSTVYAADNILVMTGGQIVESGSHAELLARSGLYARLVNTYREGK